MLFNEILQNVATYHRNFDSQKLLRTLNFASEKYTLQSKDISFSLEVISILLMFRPDEDSIAAAMLYPLYADNDLDDDDVKDLCGNRVLDILIGLKKVHALDYAENDRKSQVDILRKLFLAMAKDIRVVLISLSQRLYLMKNLYRRSSDEKNFLSKETLDVYVPIAERLGVYRIKTELEDLSFKYVNPRDYKNILDQLKQHGLFETSCIENIRNLVENFLNSKGVNVNVFGRIKSVYSIHKKLKRKGLTSVKDLYDIFAMRIVVDNRYIDAGEEDTEYLYGILGLVHSEWRPLSRRFKDYVSIPKPNGYRSLHTVVLGLIEDDFNHPVEVQIRTQNMHIEAEYGIASHWLYKKNGGSNSEFALRSQIDWIKGLQKVHIPLASESNLLKEIELDVFEDKIFVLTPRGEVKDLPAGSCPIDFAYYIHTDVGHRCYMAKVDDKVVPLDYELKSGDMVKIFTRKDSYPKLEWLSLVKTSLAKNKIKAWFNSLKSQEYLKEGRRILNSHLEKFKKPVLDQNYSILRKLHGSVLSRNEREQLLEEIGKGAQIAGDVLRQIFPREKFFNAVESEISDSKVNLGAINLDAQILIGGEEGLPVKMAKCCNAKFGDLISGYVTRGNYITVHKSGCVLLSSLDSKRVLSASWKKGLKDASFRNC